MTVAAIQIEGARNESRGATVWDSFLQSGDPKAARFGSVQVTADHYHRYESDLSHLKTLGANLYRFSFSWSRILPNCNGPVNEEAIEHYSKVIDAIISNGAEPVATMHHWDLPQACMNTYQGWAAPEIVSDFVNYADVLFSRFSSRVKYWLTMNEPSNICILGYGKGEFAPNLNLGLKGQYKCGHYSVLATAYTIQLSNKYPGITVSYPLVGSFGEPLNPNSQKGIIYSLN